MLKISARTLIKCSVVLASAMLFWVPIAQAIITLEDTSTTAASGNVANVTVATPTALAANDVMLAQITWRGNRNINSAPAGWTLIRLTQNGTTIRQAIYYRIASASEPASYQWQFSGANSRASAAISVWRGVDTSAPVHTHSGQTGNSGVLTAPTVFTTEPNVAAVAFYASANGNSDVDIDAPQTAAYQARTTAGGNGVSLAAGWLIEAAEGSLGPYSATAANTQYVAITVALKEAAPTLLCLSDDFNRSTLDSDWVTTAVSGSFGSPRIVSNRMRMTDSSGNVSTAATLQRLFPTASNLVTAEFRYYAYSSSNNSGADGIALIFSDANITPQPGGFGGSLGYAPRDGTIAGFAGGWLGIGLDEWGNFPNPTEGRLGGPGFVSDSVSVRGSGSGTSGYRYINGTGTLNPGVDDNSTGSAAAPGHRYRITIDARVAGTIPVTVERDTAGGTNYSTLLSIANIATATGQAALPDNLMVSFTGSTGGAVNIHEIDDLAICAVNMQPLVTVDHFRFLTDGEGLTCGPESITVMACANPNCTTTVAQDVKVTLTPTGWVGGDTHTLINGTGVLQLQRSTATAVPLALNVTSSSPPLKAFATSPRCFTGGPSGGTEIACQIMFRDAGFVFDVPNLTANKASDTVDIYALRSSPPSGSCVPAWTGSKTVNFFSSYTSPATGTQLMAVNSTTIGTTLATAAPLALNFDATGKASINVRYPDAGIMQLNARYDGSATTGDAGLVMTGSDQFVSSPAGFCVEARTPVSAPTTTLPNCASSACTMYQRAAVNFPLRVRAMAWELDGEVADQFCSGNLVTSNFSGDVNLNADMVDSAIDGSFSLANVTLSAGTTNANGAFSEVGRFTLATGGSYMGVALPTTPSAVIGRIVPDRFELAVANYTAHCVAGDDFSYAGMQSNKNGENFDLGTQVTAVNAAGVITQNYQGPYATLQGSSINFADLDGGSAATEGDFVPTGHALNFVSGAAINNPAWLAGTSTIPLHYRFNSMREPYTIGLRADVTDSDGRSGSSTIQGPIQFRLGRMVLENAYGPEQLSLPIPLRTEYFDGTRWRRNNADFCSNYSTTVATRDQFTGDFGSPNIEPEFDSPTINQALDSGISQPSQPLRIEAPGYDQTGSLRITLTVPSWLQFDWDGDTTHDDMPQAIATFGRYRGSDRVIYWREQIPSTPE